MPDKNFSDFIKAMVELGLTAQALEKAAPARKYITDQVYIYTSNVEAAGYYKQAAEIQAAKNAVVGGIVALCTMYVGGLIIGTLARAAATTEALTAATAGSRTLLAVRGITLLEYTGAGASYAGLSFGQTVGIELVVGVPVRGLVGVAGAAITDAYTGKAHWTEIAKIGGLAVGGALRCGPALGFLVGALVGHEMDKARAQYEKEIADAAIQKLVAAHLEAYARTLALKVKSCGQYAPLIYASPAELDGSIRQPMSDQIDKVADKIVKDETGWLGGPKRGDVYSGVAGQIGAAIWPPIAAQTSNAYIKLQMDASTIAKKMNNSFNAWLASIK